MTGDRLDPALVAYSFTRNALPADTDPLVALSIGFRPNAPRLAADDPKLFQALGVTAAYAAGFRRGWAGRARVVTPAVRDGQMARASLDRLLA